jgi:hypothetical protein
MDELYWSAFYIYELCAQRYLWTFGHPGHNFGIGEGAPRATPEHGVKSEHDRAMGKAVQYAVEKLYNDGLWKDVRFRSDRKLLERWMAEIAVRELRYQCTKATIDYREAPSQEEMESICADAAGDFIGTMRHHKLLGGFARSEVYVAGKVAKYTRIAGRVDILFRYRKQGLSLLDGKNSKFRDQYSNPDQLLWYALCTKLSWEEYPERIGFVYYRFPYGKERPDYEEPEPGLDWIPYTEKQCKEIAERAVEVQRGIFYEKFPATPKAKHCEWCPYLSVCPQRQAQYRENSAKRNRNRKNKVVLPEGAGHLFTLNMDD